MIQNIAFILLLVVATYTGYMRYLFGPLYSISESWYKLSALGKNRGMIFTAFCWTLAGLIIAVAGISNAPGSAFFFLSGAGIAFTGAAAQFKSKGAHTNAVHFAGATIAIISSLVAIGIVYGSWVPLYATAVTTLVIYILYLFKIMVRPVYWVEISSLLYIITGLSFLG